MPSSQYGPCGDGAMRHFGVPSALTTGSPALVSGAVNAVYQKICCAIWPCPGTGPASENVMPGASGGAYFLSQSMYFVSEYTAAGLFVSPPRETDAPKVERSSVKAEILEGLATIWHNRTLRSLVWVLGTWQVFRHAFIAIVVLFCARELNFSAGHVGGLFMLAGIGSLAAATLTARLNARFGMGPTMLTGIWGTGAAWLVMGAAMGPYWLASAIFGLGMFLLDLTAMVFFINYLTLRQAVTPDRLLGRVTATMICLTVSTAPLGGLAGGWIADHYGLRAAMIAAGAGAVLLGALATWLSPLAKMRELPGPQEPVVTESVAEEMAGD